MRKTSGFLFSFAILLFALGVFFAKPFWFHGKWKDGLGTEPIVIILTGWALGMIVLHLAKLVKHSIPLKEIGLLIATIWISHTVIISQKHDSIAKDKGTTNAKVLFKGQKHLHGFGIDYSYVVNGKVYSKWDNCEDFIKSEKLHVGDSVEIIYNTKNPHMHEFEKLMNK